MGLINYLQRKWNPAYPLFSGFRMGNPVWTKFNEKEAARIYNNVDVVFSCIDLIGTEAGQAKFKVVRTDSSGNSVEQPDHDLAKLLKMPNSTQDGPAFTYASVAYRLITGNSYINLNTGTLVDGKPVRDDFDTPPMEMWGFRPERVRVIPGTLGNAGYEYKSDGSAQTLTFPADEITGKSNILHWKTFNPLDDYYGLSPIQAALKGIDTYDKTVDWNKSLLDNGGRPSGALIWKGEGRMGEETYRQFKEEVDEKITKKQKRGKPIVLPGNVDWKDLSLSPRDMDFLQSKSTAMQDIARVYGIPPILLNLGSDATFSNMKEARLSLWDSTIIPLLGSYVAVLNQHVASRYEDGVSIKIDLSDVTALEPRRQGLWERAEKASAFITVNEQREMINLEPVADGDVILVNASQVPLSFAATGLGEPDPNDDGVKKKPLKT
jgi:HK97 family phage portal protein